MDTDVKMNYLQYKSGGLHESDRSSFEKSVLLYSENTSGTWSKIRVSSEKRNTVLFLRGIFGFFVNSIPSIPRLLLSEWSMNGGDIISKQESIALFLNWRQTSRVLNST